MTSWDDKRGGVIIPGDGDSKQVEDFVEKGGAASSILLLFLNNISWEGSLHDILDVAIDMVDTDTHMLLLLIE